MKIIDKLYGRDFAVCECSADEDIILTGETDILARFLGYGGDTPWTVVSLWDAVPEEERKKRRDMLSRQLPCGEVEIALPIICGDGTVRWFMIRGHICGETLVGLIVSLGRIRETFDEQHVKLTRYKERLKHTESMVSTLQVLSEQDSLTKLYNSDTTRRMCSEYLSDNHSSCAMIMLDLDGFKQVNDVLGHMKGDQVITCVAARIKKLFRSGDVVGRVGGDEFLVLMKDIPDDDIVRRKCESIVGSVSDLANELSVNSFGCSVGAVLISPGNGDYDGVFRFADAVMYDVKNNGGNGYRVAFDTDDDYKKIINKKEDISL